MGRLTSIPHYTLGSQTRRNAGIGECNFYHALLSGSALIVSMADTVQSLNQKQEIQITLMKYAADVARKVVREATEQQSVILPVLDYAVYFPEENGVLAVAALLNPTERPEQVLDVTLKVGSFESPLGRIKLSLQSVPSQFRTDRITRWDSEFPVRLEAGQASIGAMFLGIDKFSMIVFDRFMGSNGVARCTVKFETLRSGMIEKIIKLIHVQAFRHEDFRLES